MRFSNPSPHGPLPEAPTRPASVFRPAGREAERFTHYLRAGDNVVLVGPTGCGKTTLVQHTAAALGRRLEVVVGSADLTVNDLLGRWRLRANRPVWHDGPLTRAARAGAWFYLDEIGGAPEDVLKALYPLLDHRRALIVSAKRAVHPAAPGFRFIGSYNPACANAGRGLTTAFRQRCRFLTLTYLPAGPEEALVRELSGCRPEDAAFLVRAAAVTRDRLAGVLPEGAGTRLLVMAAASLAAGLPREEVVQDALVAPLSDDPGVQRTVLQALQAAGLVSLDQVCTLRLNDGEAVPLPMADDQFFDAEDARPEDEAVSAVPLD